MLSAMRLNTERSLANDLRWLQMRIRDARASFTACSHREPEGAPASHHLERMVVRLVEVYPGQTHHTWVRDGKRRVAPG